MPPRSIGASGAFFPGRSPRALLPLLLAAAAAAASFPVRAENVLAPAASFAGAADPGGGVPPDVQGAAGPEHLFTMLNTTFAAQRKSDGQVVRAWTPAEFWSAVSGGDRLFDPRIVWDSDAGRWIAAIATEGVAAAPAVLLAVSDGSDPTAGWTFRKLPVGGGEYAEFPLLGYGGRWIVMTANLISGTTGYLAGSAIWAIDRAALLGGSLQATRFTLGSPGSPIAPAVTLDPDAPEAVLLQQASGNDLGRGRVRLFRIADSGGEPALAPAIVIAAPSTWIDAPNPIESLPQAGTARRIVSDQDEFASVCVRNGRIWAVQTVTVPATAAAPLHTAVQWWRIASDGRLDGFGRIEDPQGKTWLGFPSIAVNADDRALIGYSVFSGDRFASAGYSLRNGCGGDVGLSTIHVLQPGQGPYERLDGGGHNRWGDLSQTVVDPDDARLWTLQEYAAAPEAGESRWGTWWGGFAPARSARSGACIAAPPAPRILPSTGRVSRN